MALSMDQIYEEILRDGGETPSKKVRETAQRFPDMIAMRYKEFGLWQETTYENFWLKSNYLGMALRHFGVTKGDSVGTTTSIIQNQSSSSAATQPRRTLCLCFTC